MSKIYFHIDVNNAFLSWEAIYMMEHGSKIDIRNNYSAIAGDPKTRTGVILAKSPKAKSMGVKTGESIYEAKRKCPNLELYPPHHSYYESKSKEMKLLLENYSDYIEQYSIDEYFIEYVPILGSYLDVANEIKERIFKELGFTVNIGISDTKYLAKIASDFEKPFKIHTLFKSEIKEKLWPLPIEDMFLAGKSSSSKLKFIGIDTVGKLANCDIELLKQHLKSAGVDLYNYAWGKDIDERHSHKEVPKSIGNSRTTPHDITKKEDIEALLLSLALMTSNRLRHKSMKAKNISVVVKTSSFKVYSSSKTISMYIDNSNDIYNHAKDVFYSMYKGEPLRLIGITLGDLICGGPSQISIFESQNTKEEKVDKTVDKLLDKFHNSHIITRGSLIKRKDKEDTV